MRSFWPWALLMLCLAAGPGRAADVELQIDTVAEGLAFPWSLAFLPDGRALVTERAGRLRVIVDGKLDDRAILADVWSGEEETRADTESWLFGFLLMAYRPLSDVEMADYNAFSRTGAGQALNAALFEGFEVMYRDISHALGLAAAQAMSFSEL